MGIYIRPIVERADIGGEVVGQEGAPRDLLVDGGDPRSL